jgi:hypothetical protein
MQMRWGRYDVKSGPGGAVRPRPPFGVRLGANMPGASGSRAIRGSSSEHAGR